MKTQVRMHITCNEKWQISRNIEYFMFGEIICTQAKGNSHRVSGEVGEMCLHYVY